MARYLQQLLQAQEPMFSATLRQLEKTTGRKGVDVRYIADIIHRAHSVMRRLGLDPNDTTELELYTALNSHVDDVMLFANTDDVGLLYNGHVISFNRDDVRQNTARALDQRTIMHFKCQLQHGLTARYVSASGDDETAIEALLSNGGMNKCDMTDYHETKLEQSISSQKKAPYVLCVGDIFTDVFIALKEDEAKVDVDPNGGKRLSMVFGSKLPYEYAETIAAVGPSPNASVACARLGLRSGLMSWLGDDKVGNDSIARISSEKIDVTAIKVSADTPSSTYYVLRYGAERTILVKNEQYDYRWTNPVVQPDWIYLSLIGQDSWQLHQELLLYLENNSQVKLAFQPGAFHFKWGIEKLKLIYERAYIVILNREEATLVTDIPADDVRLLATALHDLGPEIVVITDGPDGAFAL
ncbi:carbohydrate kinase family protein, partial [Candidatus Saccharibacteria bacterium]|nr:carbohydrate kinase family protein [Candidatus Saccharibacteria bacterium]